MHVVIGYWKIKTTDLILYRANNDAAIYLGIQGTGSGFADTICGKYPAVGRACAVKYEAFFVARIAFSAGSERLIL